MQVIVILFVIVSIVAHCYAANILVIFPSVSQSHVILGHALVKGLIDHGHHVTMISPIPIKEKLRNYNEIFIADLKERTSHQFLGTRYKILGLFPSCSRSHLILGEALFKALAKQGHDVTIVTPFPSKKIPPNYQEIKLGLKTKMDEDDKKAQSTFINKFSSNPFTKLSTIYGFGHKMSELALTDPEVQKLLKSNATFDLVISEVFMNEVFFAFADRFQTHAIGFSTIGATEWTNDLVGNPKEYAYSPQVFLGFTDRMNFWERLINTGFTLLNEYFYNFIHLPRQELLMQEHLPGYGPLANRLRNISLILLNSHTSLTTAKPLVPNMIEIGGFHVGKPKPLPVDLQKMLDDCSNGVIYFSMGSNIQGKDLPADTRDAFLKVFGKLKQTVLWKWEADNLPNQPKNVITRKWFPQQDILAHKNVKLFITHGGLLSTTEAITRGVPMIGIPVFGDQKLNMGNAQSLGYGLMVDFENITEQSLSWALKEVLENPRYTEVVKYRSSVLNDRLVKPIDEAVYWVEYVMRHSGAPHLRTSRNSLNFFQNNLLDLIAFVVVVISVISIIIIVALKQILRMIVPKKVVKQKRS